MSKYRAEGPARINTEPAVITGFITAVVAAAVVLATSFGLDLTDGQQDAINGFVVVLAPAIAALVIRGQVTPNVKVLEALGQGGVVAGAGHDLIAEGERVRNIRDPQAG